MSADALPQVEPAKRRSERILLRIPIEVKGTARDGKLFHETTHTLALNRHGGRIALNHEVQADSQVVITNLQSNMTCSFRAVARLGKRPGEPAEWGVECLEPGRNFWGIFFPLKADTPAEEELIDALLECSRCHARELGQLTLGGYQTMTTHGSLLRVCAACKTRTEWTFGFVQGDPGEAFHAASVALTSTSAEAIERRRAKRVPVKLPVRIRAEEIGQTEDLSQGGVCFSSSLILRVGDMVKLAVGYEPGTSYKEVSARVLWRQQIQGSNRALYGAELEEGG